MKSNAKPVPPREHLAEALRSSGGSKVGAAKALGISEPTMRTWVRARGLESLCRRPGERSVAIELPPAPVVEVPSDDALTNLARITLRDVMSDPTAPHKERRMAAEYVLDRQPAEDETPDDVTLAEDLARARERLERDLATEAPTGPPAADLERFGPR